MAEIIVYRDLAWDDTLANIRREIAFCLALGAERRCNEDWLRELQEMRLAHRETSNPNLEE